MASYFEEVKDKKITDIKENKEFQRDLVRFMSSSRKNYSVDELREKGVDWMLNEYVEHMRGQDNNEATAVKDLYFARDDEAREEDRAAFGRLMMAWDASDGAGTGKLRGAGDYAEAILTAPSTLAGVFTGGFGRLGGVAASKAASIGARASVQKFMSKEFAKQAAKGFATSAAVEGAVGLGQVEAQEGAREATVDDYEGMSAAEKGIVVGSQALLGGTIGGFARGLDRKTADKAAEILEEQSGRIAKDKAASAKKAVGKLSNAAKKDGGSEKVDRILKRMTDLEKVLAQRADKLSKSRKKRMPLDPSQVEQGVNIKETILTEGSDKKLASGLSRHTLQAITAATLDLVDKLKIEPGARISSAVANAIKEKTIDTKDITGIIDEYGLTREQFSYVFLSDLSEAGRTLGEAGKISREVQKDLFGQMQALAEEGVSAVDESLARQVADTIGAEKGFVGSAIDFAKGLDSVRIAFMTSQLGTAAANTMFSTARVGIDAVDEVFRQTLRTGGAAMRGEKVPLSSFHAVTSGIRGLTLSRGDASVLRGMFERDLPEEYNRIFYDINRAEMNADANSALGRVGAWVNTFNSGIDSRFKQASFYASVDRQLIEKEGKTLSEWLKTNNSLVNLDEDIRSKAVYDTLDFVFQKGYSKKDGAGASTANFVMNLHKKAPFVVSGFIGMPFPRYVANHIEFINDYTPLAMMTGGKKNFSNVYAGEMKDVNERWARQLTGVSLFSGAVYARGSQVEFDDEGNAVGMKTSFSDMQFGEEGETSKLGRVSGPLAAHTLLADLWVRWKYELPMPERSAIAMDALEVAGGLGNMGLDKGLVNDIKNSFDEGSFNSGLSRRFADIGATFTYPATVLRDLQGQMDPELGYTPYTRSLLMRNTNLLDAMLEDTEAANRLTRFLPETKLLQYTQSINGKTATVLMDPFSGGPVRAVNPMTKQIFGIEQRKAPTELQKQISTLGLKEYRLYGRSKLKNPATDFLVRYSLSQTMAKDFEEYISQPLKEFQNTRSWSEISDAQKKVLLERFVNDSVSVAKGRIESYWEELSVKNPKAAASFIRNSYEIQKKQAVAGVFDDAASQLSNKEFKTADAYIEDADSIEQELRRREELLRLSDIIQVK